MVRAFCNLAVFFRPRLTVYSGFEPATSRSAVRYATNSVNHSQNPAPLTKYPGFWSQSGLLCKTFRKSWSKYKWNALRRWKCSGKSRTSLTSRSGPTESCHSFFKHFRVQFYMTDREVINIKVSVKTFSNGRLG